jgi:hypothetical protein
MTPKDQWKILNYQITHHYVAKETADNSSRNKWVLIESEYVNKRSKEEMSSFGPDNGGSFDGIAAR